MRHALTRRRFLQAGAASLAGLSVPALAASQPKQKDVSCILLLMVGGPSQLDTFDPKPHAPAEIRGPFRPIATSVPGTFVSELFPRLARIAHKLAIVRTLHHASAVTHETGMQLIGRAEPRERSECWHGRAEPRERSECWYGRAEPRERSECRHGRAEPRERSECISGPDFGRSCQQARRLIEQGVRFVTVDMFATVFGGPSWDIHGTSPFSDFDQLAGDVAPAFDRAYTRLIEELDERGLLKSTMVVAVGEFGRTPRINPYGGRDHHSAAWSMLIAGGPIQGGLVIGATDSIGFAPTQRPVTTAELVATINFAMGSEIRQPIVEELF